MIDIEDRDQIMKRLEKVLKYCEENQLTDRWYYKEAKNKLEYIKNGGKFQIIDKTKDLIIAIGYIGGLIRNVVGQKDGIYYKDEVTWERVKKHIEKNC